MTRMFIHLVAVLALTTSLFGCSMLTSGDRVPPDEIESIEDEDLADETVEDFDGEDELEADSSQDTSESSAEQAELDDSFDEIEDLDEDLLEDELASEDIGEDIDDSDLEQELDEEFATAQSQDQNPESSGRVNEDTIDIDDDEFFNAEVDADLDLEDAPVKGATDVADNDFQVIEQEQDSGIVIQAAPTQTVGLDNNRNRVTNLEYKSYASGGTVVISALRSFNYQLKEEPEFNQVVVEVADVYLPQSLKRPYIAKDFGQPIATINAYQEPGATTARFVIQYKNPIVPSASLNKNRLLIVNSATAKTGLQAIAKTDSKKISIQVDDVDISEVINLIASETGVNIMVDGDVKGSTSVSLIDVPWDRALMSILKSRGLGYKRQGNILRIASQSKLAGEAENYNKQVTNEIDAKRKTIGRKVRFFPVNYADVGKLVNQVKPFLTKDGKASADEGSNSLVVVDFVDILDKVNKVIKALDTEPLQIMIEGKIVEASEEIGREIGMNLGLNGSNDLGEQILNSSIGSNNPIGSFDGGFGISLQAGTFDVIGDLTANLALREREEKIKVLSSPRIMVLNKETATISQTTQIPFVTPTAQAGGGTATQALNQTQFQDVNLSLTVKPQISFTGDVLMEVTVKRDIPGAAAPTGARQLEKRSAKTKVLVPNGKTMVIGGIYQNDLTERESGVPFLKEIPLLGFLFRSRFKEVVKNELLIFLTPKVVNPELMKKAFQMGLDSQIESKADLEDDFLELDDKIEEL